LGSWTRPPNLKIAAGGGSHPIEKKVADPKKCPPTAKSCTLAEICSRRSRLDAHATPT